MAKKCTSLRDAAVCPAGGAAAMDWLPVSDRKKALGALFLSLGEGTGGNVGCCTQEDGNQSLAAGFGRVREGMWEHVQDSVVELIGRDSSVPGRHDSALLECNLWFTAKVSAAFILAWVPPLW
jgi:hypothetical protein